MLKPNEEKFTYNEEKLNFIVNYLNIDAKEIADLFGVKASYVSKLLNYSYATLKPMHLYAFSSAYTVPYAVFDKSIKTSTQVIELLEEHKKEKSEVLFKKNEKLLEDIQGDWYAYFYPSNRFANIYCIKTTINLDGSIEDENGNWGKLFTGTNQSLIIKETRNSKNFVSITFDNHQVAYDMFHFSLVSKRNHNNLEMFNYGFFSRYEIEPELLKKILGGKEKVQLKMECDFAERISEYVEILR